MTPVTTRPSLDSDRTYLQVGAFINAFITEATAKGIQVLSGELGLPIELVPMLERREIPPEALGSEVGTADY